MGNWVYQSEDTNLPDWLNESLSASCSYCGSPMMDFYNETGRCTNRKCSNNGCPGLTAAKADFVRRLLKMDGLGFKTCLNDVKASGSKSPFELLDYWGAKPLVPLSMFLRMHCFEGVDNEWETITAKLGVYTLEELYEKYDGKWKPLLEENKELIYSNLKYVGLQKRPTYLIGNGPKATVTIMITGTPIGFATKDDFVNQVNIACRGLVQVIHQKTKKQSGVDALICEAGTKTTGKVDTANKAGIPILTSEQFISAMVELVKRITAES